MSTIVTRAGKGSPLTNTEVDANFTNLNTDKQEILAEGAFVDGDKTKLDGLESGATADQTASEILTAIKTVDGTGSGLDADTVDGLQASSFLRSDADDTASGNITFTGDLTFDGVTRGIYHAVEEDHYYFDSYSGTRMLNPFLETIRSDIIRYQPIDNVEYWDGSNWQDGSSQLSNVKRLLDGRKDTSWYVPSTYYKFRFTVTASSSWPTLCLIGAELSWTGSSFPGFQMLVEELQTDSSWSTKVTSDFNSSNGVSNWGTAIRADSALHTGRGGQNQATRITIDFYGWTPSNQSYTTIPLQNLFILSNYSGIENNDHKALLDYDKNLSISGNISVSGTVDGRDVAADGATLDAVASTYVDVSGDTLTGDLAFGDNVKAEFGDGGDLQIYHDGTNSWINDVGTGDLILRGNNVRLMSAALEYYLYASADGAVSLYHNNAGKLATTSTGVDVTGTVTATDLVLDEGSASSVLLRDSTATNGYQIRANVSSSADYGLLVENLAGQDLLRIKANSDIVFLDDGGTSEDLYWDASTSRLGIRNTAPTYDVDIVGDVNTDANLRIGHQNRTTTGQNSTFLRMATNARASDGVNRYSRYDFKMTPLNDFGNANLTLKYRNDGVDKPDVLNIRPSGDIEFFAQDGTTSDFYWDKSTSRLGLGTTTPSGVIHAVSSGVSNFVFQGADVGEGTLFQIRNGTNNSATGNGHRLEFVHGNNDSRNVFFRTSSTGTFGRSPDLYIGSQNDSGGAELDHVRIRAGGDVSFYNDDSTSENFYWDASTSRLGLGTTSPDSLLNIKTTSPTLTIQDSTVSFGSINSKIVTTGSDGSGNPRTDVRYLIGSDGNAFTISYGATPTERMRIDSSGNVGIGTTSPEAPLEIAYTTSAPSLEESDAGLLLSANNTLRTLFGADPSSPYAHWIQVTNSSGSAAFPLALNPQGGNVGIGTTSPDSLFHISSGGPKITITDTTFNADATIAVNDAGSLTFSADANNERTNSRIQFDVDGSEAMRIDDQGRLGIGTTSPLSDIHIAKSAPIIRMEDTDNNSYAMIMYNTASGGLLLRSDHNQATGTTGSNIIFQTDASEAARIDSSGNLLVGKTAPSESSDGAELRSSGFSTFTRNNNNVMVINRRTSDGDIVTFKKDGSTVGSIGADNTDNIFLSGNSSHSGLMVGTESIVPYANGNTSDATEDLGVSSIRWRNLYLSGDVISDGTVTSNIDINAQTGTTYTTVLTDRSKLVTLDNASAVTVTIPPNSSVAYPTGTKIDLLAKGAGQVTVAAGSGVTVNSSQTLNLRAQWSAASVIKLATDTWVLVGDLEAS